MRKTPYVRPNEEIEKDSDQIIIGFYTICVIIGGILVLPFAWSFISSAASFVLEGMASLNSMKLSTSDILNGILIGAAYYALFVDKSPRR